MKIQKKLKGSNRVMQKNNELKIMLCSCKISFIYTVHPK